MTTQPDTQNAKQAFFEYRKSLYKNDKGEDIWGALEQLLHDYAIWEDDPDMQPHYATVKAVENAFYTGMITTTVANLINEGDLIDWHVIPGKYIFPEWTK